MREALELRQQLNDSGVTLFLADGQLRARGGNFSPELRKAASAQKRELEKLIAIEQSEREAKLSEAKASWMSYASPERGFFIGELRNAVTAILLEKLEKAEADYLSGLTTLKAVHSAFSDYAKASRRHFLNRQLEGDIFFPALGGSKTSQKEIHLEFLALDNTEAVGDMERVIRSSVTPQIEPQPDQLERIAFLFGITPEEYAASRTTSN